MRKGLAQILAGLFILALSVFGSTRARTQTSEVKEKPPMYSYVGFWTIARPQWADWEKQTAANQKVMDKALADGAIVGYGTDFNLVHQPDGATHDNWWSSMSLAGLLNTLDQIYKSGSATSPVAAGAARHWDGIYVSRYYNWQAGSWKEAYSRVATYQLKPDAPENALDTLSKSLFGPLLEKMLADGSIHEYEIDTEAIHTESPATFVVAILAANAEALDKFQAAARELAKANPLLVSSEKSMIDIAAHRDFLLRSNATYK
jgi:hypothetical protein